MGGPQFNCFNVKSGVINKRVSSRSQRLRSLCCSVPTLDPLACFGPDSIWFSPSFVVQPLSAALKTTQNFAVQASREKLRTKLLRRITTIKVACFTRIERHSTPLLSLECSIGSQSGWKRWSAGFTPRFGIAGGQQYAGSGFEVHRLAPCSRPGASELRTVGLKKEFLTQQGSQFVT